MCEKEQEELRKKREEERKQRELAGPRLAAMAAENQPLLN